MVMNVDFGPKLTLFGDPFAQIRTNTIFWKTPKLSHFSLCGCPTSCKVTEKSNVTVMRKGHECWFWPKMDLFLGPFCPNKGKYDFLKTLNLLHFSLYGCPTSCKVTEKSNVTVMRNGHECWFWRKMDLFLGPFCPNKGKYDFFEKIGISQILAPMDAQLPAKLQ